MGTRLNQVAVHFADKTLAGVPCLLDDLQQLVNSKETADILFLIGPEEVEFYAHKLLLWTRCHAFKQYKREFWGSGNHANGMMSFKYPHYSPELFKEVLNYIYTGKIILQESSVFLVLAVSQEMGIMELQRCCEEHITGTLTAATACSYFGATRQMRRVRPSISSTFEGPCQSYIEQNAEECVRTEGWLKLHKDALTHILQSDNFALEEEEVWRAVLSWAKYQAGISLDKKTQNWNEQEKAAVCAHLGGVIEHVKLLLIDSTVFAEEVEPTGAVPMEMSLERYRFAAVPNKVNQSDDKKLRPRVCVKLFQGTEILVKSKLQFQRVLNSWYGNSKQTWKLLYRASTDGYTAESFHTRCDGHAPTYIIIVGTTGNICGGYSDVPWTSTVSPRGKYMASEKAFLFTLVNNQDVPPTRFPVCNAKFATHHHPHYGPIFGAGADLSIANNCNTGMECYSNLPHSFSGDQASSAILMGDYNFNILDYEVFTTK